MLTLTALVSRLGITHSSPDQSIPPSYIAVLPSLVLFLALSLNRIMDNLKPCGSCMIAPFFLKQLNVVGSLLLILLNCSLETGTVPDLLKHSTVHPLLTP